MTLSKPCCPGVLLLFLCLLPQLPAAAPAAAGSFAFVTNQSGSDLSILDLDGRREIKRLAVEGAPAGVAVSTRLDAFFTVSPGSKTVRRYSVSRCTQEASVTLPGGPTGIALAPRLGLVFVSDWYNARIFVLDAQTLALTGTLETGSAPAGLVVSAEEAWLASADRDSDQVSIFTLPDLTLRKRVSVGARPFGIAEDPDGLIHVANVGADTVSVIKPGPFEVIATVPVGARPYGLAFAKGLGFSTDQYADTVTVYRLSDFRKMTAVSIGEYPEGIDVTADERWIVATNWFSNTVSLIETEGLSVVAEIPTGDGPRAFGRFVMTFPDGRVPCAGR